MINLEIISNTKYNLKNNIYHFRINTSNNPFIIIKSLKKQIIQFKLNTKLIESICIKVGTIIKEYNKIPWFGLLINYNIEKNEEIEIFIKAIDNCGEINIWDIENIYNIKLTEIKWDKIFIINLKRRNDRKKSMEQKLLKENIINYEFIEAIDGCDIEIKKEYEQLKLDDKTKIINSGHYACLLSHIKVIELAKKNLYKNIMILEDDVMFEPNFMNIIKKIRLPKFNLIYLGGIIPEIKCGINGWIKTNGIMGAYGYIINHKLYDKILYYLKNNNNYVDVLYIEKIQPNYKVYLLNDYIKTNLDSSDTSKKNKKLVRMLNNIV